MVLTCEQIRATEQRAVELGMSWLRLMENAGSAAAREIRNNYKPEGKKIVIVCGKGNNGGDGYVIARKLLENNAQIKVIAIDAPNTQSAKEMASKAVSLGIKPIDFVNYENICRQYIKDADIVVDAIFGIGLNSEPEGYYKAAISAINDSSAVKVAVDVPSGISGDSGYIKHHSFVKADMTISFAAYKPCHLLFPSSNYCGKIVPVSIGMPDEAFAGIVPAMQVITEQYVAKRLPTRSADCHKGICGTAGIFAGNKGFAGAAVIAGKAAVKSGAGIVNMIIPESVYSIVGISLPEAVCTVLNGDQNGYVHINDAGDVVDALNKCTAGLIGCGLTNNYNIKHIVSEILRTAQIPLVIDADGINVLTDCIDIIKQYKGDVVLTPHPKEAARILGLDVEAIQDNRLYSAKRIAAITNAVTVLKGAKTIIACPNGNAFVVTDGNAGMATAGTGDMLAGMIVAFLAQGLSSEDAAVSSVKLHAMAGDLAVENTSILSLTPTDMINTLSTLYCRMYLKK